MHFEQLRNEIIQLPLARKMDLGFRTSGKSADTNHNCNEPS